MYMDTYGLDQVSLLGATESALRKCWKKVGPLGIPSENKLFPKWKPVTKTMAQKVPKGSKVGTCFEARSWRQQGWPSQNGSITALLKRSYPL